LKIQEDRLIYMSLVVRPVQSFSDLKAAFSLVYQEYMKAGYQEKHSSGMRYFYHQLFPQSFTYVVEVDGKLVGTGTLVSGRSIGFPSEESFKEELQSLILSGRRVCEATMLACHDYGDFHATEFANAMISTSYSWLASEGIDDVCVVCHPKHLPFWIERVGCDVIGSSKLCSYVKGNPGVLVRCDLNAWRKDQLTFKNETKRVLPKTIRHLESQTPQFVLMPHEIQDLLDARPEIFMKTPPFLRRQLIDCLSSGNSMIPAMAA